MADVVTPQPDTPVIAGRQLDSPGNSYLAPGRARVAPADMLAAGHPLSAPRVPGIAESGIGGPVHHVDQQPRDVVARTSTTWQPELVHAENPMNQGINGAPASITVAEFDYRSPAASGNLPRQGGAFADRNRADHELTPTPVRSGGVSLPGGPHQPGMGEDVARVEGQP